MEFAHINVKYSGPIGDTEVETKTNSLEEEMQLLLGTNSRYCNRKELEDAFRKPIYCNVGGKTEMLDDKCNAFVMKARLMQLKDLGDRKVCGLANQLLMAAMAKTVVSCKNLRLETDGYDTYLVVEMIESSIEIICNNLIIDCFGLVQSAGKSCDYVRTGKEIDVQKCFFDEILQIADVASVNSQPANQSGRIARTLEHA